MPTFEENLVQLREAGFFVKTPLPEEYEGVIGELSAGQVSVLVEVKQMFDTAQDRTRGDVAPYMMFLVPL
jgi:hypothetical protein